MSGAYASMTPAQIERRRASREAWRARNPREWEARRGVRQGPAGPAGSGRVRQGPAALLAAAEALEAGAAEIKRAALAGSGGVRQGPAGPAGSGRVRQRGDGSPPREFVNPPSGDEYRGVSPSSSYLARAAGRTTTTTTGATPANFSVWETPEVREALATRPGIDVALLNRRLERWLDQHPEAPRSVNTALGFIERWRPAIDNAPVSPGGGSRSFAAAELDERPGTYDAHLAEMQTVLNDIVAGKIKPPAPDEPRPVFGAAWSGLRREAPALA